MRNRKDSVRKQDRKFAYSFPKPAAIPQVKRIYTDAEIDAMYWIPKASRNLLKRAQVKLKKEQT